MQPKGDKADRWCFLPVKKDCRAEIPQFRASQTGGKIKAITDVLGEELVAIG